MNSKIFLSYSTPIRLDQKILLMNVKRILLSLSLEIIEVNNINDISVSPLPIIIKKMQESDCCICLAFEKRESLSLDTQSVIQLSSRWVDIEVAIAMTCSLPVIIFKEEHLADTEILNIQQNTIPIYPLKTSKAKSGKNSIDIKIFEEDYSNYLKTWLFNHTFKHV